MSKKNVIITDAHYRAAVSAVRELGYAGHHVTAAYPVTERRPIGALSRACASEYRFTGLSAQALLEMARSDSAVIFPAGARFLRIMAERREDFAPYTLVSDISTLNAANDKTHVASVARKLGIRTPETLNGDDAEALKYPVIVKYVDGESLGLAAERRYRIAFSAEDLQIALKDMGENPVFISEYIAGSGYGVSVLMDREHRAVQVFCHERLREYPLSGGPSVMCKSVWCEDMAQDAVRLLKELDFEGLAMVEFKGAPDDYALLEINPRVWGSYPLSYLSGAGFAERFVRAAAGETLPEVVSPEYTQGVRMQYYLSGARWALASMKKSKSPMPVLRYVSDIFNPKVRHGLWSWRDMKPGLAYARIVAKRGSE